MPEATLDTPSAAPLKGDPFFAQLKTDIEEGIAAADRGELFTAEEARASAQDPTRDTTNRNLSKVRYTSRALDDIDALLLFMAEQPEFGQASVRSR